MKLVKAFYKIDKSEFTIGEERSFHMTFIDDIKGTVKEINDFEIVLETEDGDKKTITAEDIASLDAIELRGMLCTSCFEPYVETDVESSCPSCGHLFNREIGPLKAYAKLKNK